MIWLKEAEAPFALPPGRATELQPKKNLESALKEQKQRVLKKMFLRIVSGHNH